MSSGRYTKVVTGYEDIFLSGTPKTSYFLKRYSKKLPNYETYIIETNILDQVNYGTLLRTVIPEKGDIINGLIIKVIVPTDYISIYASYALIEYCDLIIGGQLIDRLTGEYMSLLLDKKCSYTRQTAVGIFGTTVTNASLKTDAGLTQLFFEIPFYFFNKLHLGVPICALYKHKVEFHVKIKEWTLLKETLFYSDVSTWISRYEDNKQDNVIPMKVFSTLVEYLKVPDEIKERIKNSTMTYTITQTQLQHELIPKYADTFDTSLKFINPVHNLLFYYKTRNDIDHKLLQGGAGSRLDDFKWWKITNDITTPTTHYDKIKALVYKYGNALFKTVTGTEVPPDIYSRNFGYPLYFLSFEFSSLHHMIDLELQFNGETIIDPDNSGHFLMMNQVHKLLNKGVTNTPMIYSILGVVPDYSPCYYFHNFTENYTSENPGGQVNFSRIRDKDLHINLVPSVYDRTLHIYAQSNNILKVKDGMGGLMFTSPLEYQAYEFIPKAWYYNMTYFVNSNVSQTVTRTIPDSGGVTYQDPDINGFSSEIYGLSKQERVPYVNKLFGELVEGYYAPYAYYFYDKASDTYVAREVSGSGLIKYIDITDLIIENNPRPVPTT